MRYPAFLLFIILVVLFGMPARSQDLKTTINANKKQQDSLRKALDKPKDSVVFNASYIRYTTLALTKDSIQTLPIDTSLKGLQNFSPLVQPRRPRVNTGNLGLAARPLLFEPNKTIGFSAGFHALDDYTIGQDDVRFYKARTQFTSLAYINAGEKEQLFKVIYTQNIKKNWNFGATYDRIGANGAYTHQRGDHLNATVFTWYESPGKRYNLWVDGVFNTLKAQENGSTVKQNIFDNTEQLVNRLAESVRLYTAKQFWRRNSVLIRQSYFVGRIDSTGKNSSQNILPTNKISYTFLYDKQFYVFKKNEQETDIVRVLPEKGAYDDVFTNDSTQVKHFQNEVIYSFFLRQKGNTTTKNELKIDAGIRHDIYRFGQYNIQADNRYFYADSSNFQNTSLLGVLGYRFSNRIDLNVNIQQIFQGRNIGDFLYEAKSNLVLGRKAGQMLMNAYIQNKSPEEIYQHYIGNHYQWDKRSAFDRTKIVHLSFNYAQPLLQLDAGVSYYLVNNYLYFTEGAVAKSIVPVQESNAINIMQLHIGKRFDMGSFHLDAYAVYQKTDSRALLRTPEFYTFNSLYKEQTFFKVLKTQIGLDVRYNSAYTALSYSPAASQFYNGDPVVFGHKPIADFWIKASLRRANLLLKYDYVNQGLLSKGYYTVNDYPMPDRLLKLGVVWNFYD